MEERGGQSGWGGYSFHSGGKASYLIENAVRGAASPSEEDHEEGDARHKKKVWDDNVDIAPSTPIPAQPAGCIISPPAAFSRCAAGADRVNWDRSDHPLFFSS